jgi:hypothetical protein
MPSTRERANRTALFACLVPNPGVRVILSAAKDLRSWSCRLASAGSNPSK